ncbi:unnamed protein product [Closterium sp. NIES-53]
MLHSDCGGEFLGKDFTTFVDGKGIVHDLTCPYTPQQNGMAEREMRTVVEFVRTMLLHMAVETPLGTTPYQMLIGKKPDLTLAWVRGCMVQFMVPGQQRGGKLAPKARWGLHLGVSLESKGWEVLDLTDKKVVTLVEVIFYETLSLEEWKVQYGPASGQTTDAFLQSKLDRVLYMYQPDYYDDGIGRVCKLQKSLYGPKQSPLLRYKALDNVLTGAAWKKSQVDDALYLKVGDDGVTCWVLVYVDDLLAASSSTAMLKELKKLLEAAFELREISPIVKYLGSEIVRDRSARKLWLHQKSYVNKLRRRFIDEEQTGWIPKTPVFVDAHAKLAFDNEEAQGREEEYRQKVGSLQLATTITRLDIAFACSTLGRDLMYVAAVDAGKEGRRIHFLLAEFKLLDAGTPTVLQVDNKSAITVAEGLGLKGNLKHMERRYAWLQHMVKRGKFVL